MFGKVMSITDEIIPMYYRLCSTLYDELDAIDKSFEDRALLDPYQLKRALVEILLIFITVREKASKHRRPFDAQFKNNSPWMLKSFVLPFSG